MPSKPMVFRNKKLLHFTSNEKRDFMKNTINKIQEPLTPLLEDERIYLNVPYMARTFAKHSHCGFDTEKKLWFTGVMNSNILALIKLYGVNEATSDKAKQQLKEKFKNE